MHVQFSSDYNEMELENSLAKTLKGKCDAFSERVGICTLTLIK